VEYDIAVLGGGESGVGAAVLAQSKGLKVFLSDKGTIKQEYKDVLSQHSIPFEEGNHDEPLILACNEIVKSPGIPDTVELIKQAVSKEIPVISEIEFAYRYTQAKIVGITGTNGKTTTTHLVFHIMKKAGLNVAMAGNVGDSFALSVAKNDFDYYVLELSSFQLDGIVEFRPHIAIILNISPDHLGRYEGKIENYIASKFRITKAQDETDFLILNSDSELVEDYRTQKNFKAKLLTFSWNQKEEEGAWIENNNIIINHKQKPVAMSIMELALQGKHNVYNSMASGIAARILEIRKEVIRESLSDFQNVEHRLEQIIDILGVTYINDSKATNVNSTWWALESMDRPVVWIAGGVDKGNDYRMLQDLVGNKVKALVCLGKDNTKLQEAFADDVELVYDADSMREAVGLAYQLAKKGDAVLLSPACASFDLFENYEDRGHQFKEWVRRL